VKILSAQLLVTLLLAAMPVLAHATAQAPDQIIIDGRTERLHTSPLSSYLEANPKALPEPTFISSGNWRGYIATWEVRESDLILKKIEIEDSVEPDEERKIRDVLPTVFPGKSAVLATWYSGVLVIPKGDQVHYVHLSYGSTYERYTILVVKDGKITRRQDLQQEEFERYRERSFAEYKKTPEYLAEFKDMTEGKDAWSEKDAEAFLFQFTENYLSKDHSTAD
jgi:hypothetical protein